MRQAVRRAGLLTCCAGLAWTVAGCSGAGVSSVPPSLAELQTVANDHLSALVLTANWFRILYQQPPVNPPCKPHWGPRPRRPGDPPGSSRWHGVMSDCTEMDVLFLADGSGKRTTHSPEGRLLSTLTWGPAWHDGSWTKQSFELALRDGPKLEYESGFDRSSPKFDHYARGNATVDRRRMDFHFKRNLDRDEVLLTPSDHSHLDVQVPLTSVTGHLYWPRFGAGAPGTYRSATGAKEHFTVGSATGNWWETWSFTAPNQFAGQFTLGTDYAGQGTIRKAGVVVAALSWDAAGHGKLDPVSGGAIDAVPSAAAGAFQINQWLGSISGLGPMPLY